MMTERAGTIREGAAIAAFPRLPVGLVLVTIVSCLAFGCGSARVPGPTKTRYLQPAIDAGHWLQTQASSDRRGAIPDETDRDSAYSGGLGTGASGRVVFFLELFGATGDSTFLASAEAEGDAAMALTSRGTPLPGLYNGLAGIGFALTELAKFSTHGRHYRQAAATLFEEIVSQGVETGGSMRWGTANDVMTGAAGIGLALVYASREYDRDDFLDAARAAGRELLAAADTLGSTIRWRRWTDRNLDLPNFSHGTAGVAYFLATLSEATDDPEFLQAARKGADYLVGVADTAGGLFLVPYGIPNEGYVTKYDVGWAHGPAGTARLFYRLWRLTGEDQYRDKVDACARSIIASGVPTVSSDTLRWVGPFGIDRRFGLSGVVAFLLDWYRDSGHLEYLETARRSADAIREAADRTDQGLYWTIPRYGFQGTGESIFTGYFYGSAGMGLALLHMHQVESGTTPRIRFPDDPW